MIVMSAISLMKLVEYLWVWKKKPDPVNRNKEVCEMYIVTYVKDKTLFGTGG